ncbi:hypothetical protein KA183_11005 [bacterium]|nr:hypothetical protein [bacterium]
MQNVQNYTKLNFQGIKDMGHAERTKEQESEQNSPYMEYQAQKDEQEMISMHSHHLAILLPANCQADRKI